MSTVQPGRYRIEVRASFSDASAEFSASRFNEAVRRWPSGTPLVTPGAVTLAASTTSNPSTTVAQTRDNGRINVRSAVVLTVVQPMNRNHLARLFSAALYAGGAVCDQAALTGALDSGRRVSSDEAHAPLTTATLAVIRQGTTAARAPTPAASRTSTPVTSTPAAPVREEPPVAVIPPAATLAEQLQGGTQRVNDAPAEPVRVNVREAIRAGDGPSFVLVVAGTLVVLGMGYYAVKHWG